MHAWLSFRRWNTCSCCRVAYFSQPVLGITYYGLALQIEVTLAVILLVVAGIVAWLFYVGVKAQFKRVKTGKEALIGAKGVATTDLKPKGEVRVLGEFWQAIAKDGDNR